jgi:membrane protein required for colicin V production
VTQFDFILLALLLISAAVGFARGAVREVAALFALLVAGAAAVLGLPVYAPVFRAVIHPPWLGTVAGLVVIFGVTYALLRFLAAGLARRVQSTQVVGFLDRSLGLLIGVVRGLLVLGVLYLMFNAATPKDLQPRWITESMTWPLARYMGAMEQAMAPKYLGAADKLRPALDRAVQDGSRDRSATDGYEAPGRGGADDREKSR